MLRRGIILSLLGSICPEVTYKNGALKNLAKFTINIGAGVSF